MADETPLWSDNPTARDLLGFEDIAAGLIEALEREKLDPVALGVFGDWGSGKTSVLEITQAALGRRDKTIVVFTRPWEYDPRTDPKATLISEVLAAVQVEAEKSAKWADKLKDGFESLRARVDFSKAISLVANTAVTLSLPSIDKVVEVFSKEGAPVEPTLKGFREDFSKLMAELDDVDRVVVLVDDLDRCLPPTVVAALEAIKLFLSVPKMGFVIAADERLVHHAIADQYQGAARADTMAREYLEKIVQIPVRVPVIGLADIEAYLSLLLLESHLPDEDGDVHPKYQQLVKHCGERRTRALARLWDELPDGTVPESSVGDLALAKMLAPILAKEMGGNPRRIKRFLNAYWMRAAIARRRGADPKDPAALAKLMVLEELEPAAFGKLVGWLGQETLDENLRALEDGAQDAPDDPKLRSWAAHPPKLAGTDLGPYLRLAASLRALPAPSALRSELEELLGRLLSDKPGDRREAQQQAAERHYDDQRSLASELAGAIISRPNDADDAAESLGELIKTDQAGDLTTDVAVAMRDLDAKLVTPAVVVRLAGTAVAPDMAATFRAWQESGRLTELAANAVTEMLDGGT